MAFMARMSIQRARGLRPLHALAWALALLVSGAAAYPDYSFGDEAPCDSHPTARTFSNSGELIHGQLVLDT